MGVVRYRRDFDCRQFPRVFGLSGNCFFATVPQCKDCRDFHRLLIELECVLYWRFACRFGNLRMAEGGIEEKSCQVVIPAPAGLGNHVSSVILN